MVVSCSFCGDSIEEGRKIIKGQTVDGYITYICYNCLEKCNKAIRRPNKNSIKNVSNFIPSVIYDKLDEVVEGQEEAKKILAVATHLHYQRVFIDSSIDKSNVLLVGPSGSGKTFLVENLAKILNVPVVVIDATSLTEAGFAGEDVDSCITHLLQESNYNVESAERGIVLIDEVDKLKRASNGINSRDVSGEGVQQGLLKLIEGKVVSVNSKKSSMDQPIRVNTRNILFICSGAFAGLEKIVKQNVIGSSISLFSTDHKTKKDFDQDNWGKYLTSKHLIDYGLIREFVGRLPVHCVLKAQTLEQLENILCKSENNSLIYQMKKRFDLSSVSFKWSKQSITAIAKEALTLNVGARGLRTILEKKLSEAFFLAPKFHKNMLVELDHDGNVIIHKDYNKISVNY